MNSIKYIRRFCKKSGINTTLQNNIKKERWFDRHLDPTVTRIQKLNSKKIELDAEMFTLQNEIMKINKEIQELLSNKKNK